MMTLKMFAKPAFLTRLAAPVVLGCTVLLGACDNPTANLAQLTNYESVFQVHALTGSPLIYPSALAIALRAPAHVDGTFSFDVAFDLNAAGQIVLVPVALVGQNPSGQRTVGIQVIPGGYDALTAAPKTGYNSDSVTVAKAGDAIAVQSTQIACQGRISPYLYAKIVIDSLNLPSRTLYGRTIVDINCGFRALTIGLPTF